MDSNNYTTLRWIMLWSMITIITGWWAKQTQESWTFYIVVASFVILVLGIVLHRLGGLLRRRRLQNIDVRYLIPKEHYPLKEYPGAPTDELYPRKLTIGIGDYMLLLEIKSELDILFDPIVLLFEGENVNKPRFQGKGNPFIVETLKDGSYRDWHDNVSLASDKYPRYLYKGDFLIDGNKIQTTGQWHGLLHVRIPVREAVQIDKYLEFAVATDKDDTPFLKLLENQIFCVADSTTNAASTILGDKKNGRLQQAN